MFFPIELQQQLHHPMVRYRKHLNEHLSYMHVLNLPQQLFVINLPHLYHLNQQVVELLLYVNNSILLNIHLRLPQQKHPQEQNHQSHQYLLIILYDHHLPQQKQQRSKKLHPYQRLFLNLKQHRNQLNLFLNSIFLMATEQRLQQWIHYFRNNYDK
jgi:hypothetical protein